MLLVWVFCSSWGVADLNTVTFNWIFGHNVPIFALDVGVSTCFHCTILVSAYRVYTFCFHNIVASSCYRLLTSCLHDARVASCFSLNMWF